MLELIAAAAFTLVWVITIYLKARAAGQRDVLNRPRQVVPTEYTGPRFNRIGREISQPSRRFV